MIEVSGDSIRCKRLLPTIASSPDRSTQTRKGHKTSEKAQHQSPKFRDLPPPSSTTNNTISNTPEEVQEIIPNEIAFSHMNVEELLECSATEVKVVMASLTLPVQSSKEIVGDCLTPN